MNAWMDGWVGGWVGGWMDGWVGGWGDGWINGWNLKDLEKSCFGPMEAPSRNVPGGKRKSEKNLSQVAGAPANVRTPYLPSAGLYCHRGTNLRPVQSPLSDLRLRKYSWM
jgi:hypothetical protein